MEQPERITVRRYVNGTVNVVPPRFPPTSGFAEVKDVEYIRKDLAIQIPPEGPERDELVERLVRAIRKSEEDAGGFSSPLLSVLTVLAALIGEK